MKRANDAAGVSCWGTEKQKANRRNGDWKIVQVGIAKQSRGSEVDRKKMCCQFITHLIQDYPKRLCTSIHHLKIAIDWG